MAYRDNKNRAQIPNEIFDEIFPSLMDSEVRVVAFIARKTFGFNKQSDDISYSQFEAGTRYKRASIMRIIERLERKGVIFVKRVPGGYTKKSNNYSINLEWCQDVSHEKGDSQETSSKETSPTSRVTGHPPAEKSPGDVTHQPPTKHIIPKHNIQNTQDARAAHPFDIKRGGIPEPILEQLQRIEKLSGRAIHAPSLLVPADEAVRLIGLEAVVNALRGIVTAYEDPRQDRERIPRQLVPFLRSADRMLDWGSRVKPTTPHPETGPPYLSDPDKLRKLVAKKQSLGSQLTPQEVEACRQFQIVAS